MSIALKVTIRNYFFVKKVCQKNGKKSKKMKINFFLQTFLKNGHFETKVYGESKNF